MIDQKLQEKIFEALGETLYMSSVTIVFVIIFGLLLGALLFLSRKGGLWENQMVYRIIDLYCNVSRSIPFILILILLIPATSAIMGTIYGAKAALPALIISATPFFARIVETSFVEVDKGVVEASQSLGASTIQIIYKVLLREALPSLISGLTLTMVTLIGYTALAGAIGAGGLGYLAYLYGYQRGNYPVMYIATILLLLIVFLVQLIGSLLTHKFDKR